MTPRQRARGLRRVRGPRLLVLLAIVLLVRGVVTFVAPPTRVVLWHRSPLEVAALPHLSVPASPESAVIVPQLGQASLNASPVQRVVPIASLAKLMTALLVVDAHPLRGSEAGPLVEVRQADVTQTAIDVSQDQSTVPLFVGERLSERQLLEALLVRSANNVASMLASWVSGSQAAFVSRMNVQARAMGLRSTHFADASGFDPQTVSTAHDVALLAAAVLRNPVLRVIVDEHDVTLPRVGTLVNYVPSIGVGAVVGVKSGFTVWSGGCAAIAVRSRTDAGPLTAIGVSLGVQGYESLPRAVATATAIARAALAHLHPTTLLRPAQPVGAVLLPWLSHPILVRASRGVWALIAPGQRVTLQLSVNLAQRRGEVVVRAGHLRVSVPTETLPPLPSPSVSWLLAHDLTL